MLLEDATLENHPAMVALSWTTQSLRKVLPVAVASSCRNLQKNPDDSFDDDTWHCCGVLHYHLSTRRKSNTFTKPENRKLCVEICITSPTSSSKRRFRECGFVNIPLMMRQNITLFSYISRQEPHWHYLSFPSAPGVARLAEDVWLPRPRNTDFIVVVGPTGGLFFF